MTSPTYPERPLARPIAHRRHAWTATLLACLMAAFVAHPAAAQDTAATRCIADAENGQKTRDDGKLIDARALFVRCGAETCPSVVSRECVRWVAQVDERLPTIVLATRDDRGKDILGAEIVLDGAPVAAANVGRELPLDPGPHALRASRAGYRTATESIVVREREKGRGVSLVLERNDAPRAGTAQVSTRARSIPTMTWILGGVAVIGGGGFAYFWNQGMDEVSSLRATCAPYCSAEQIDGAREPLTIARISLGVGVAAAVGAVLFYVLQPTATAQRTGGRRAPLSLTF